MEDQDRIGRLVTDHGDKLVASIDEATFSDWLNGLRGTCAHKAGDKLTLTTRENLKKTCRMFFAPLHRPRMEAAAKIPPSS